MVFCRVLKSARMRVRYIIKDPLAIILRNANPTFMPGSSLMTLKPSGESAYQIGKGSHVKPMTTARPRSGELPFRRLSPPSLASETHLFMKYNKMRKTKELAEYMSAF